MGGDEKTETKVKPQAQTDFERMQLDRASMLHDPILDMLGFGFNGDRLQYYGQGGQNPLNGGGAAGPVKTSGGGITDISPMLQGQGTGLGLGGQQPFMDDQSRLAGMATGGGGGGLGLSGADAYWQSRPDVQADPYYGSSPEAAYQHFQQFGQGEGSQWMGGAPQQRMGAPDGGMGLSTTMGGGGGDPTMSLLAMQYKAAEAKYNDGDGSARDRNAFIAARDQMREFGVDPTQPGALDKFLQGTSYANPQEREGWPSGQRHERADDHGAGQHRRRRSPVPAELRREPEQRT
jgi:hypothetical protein